MSTKLIALSGKMGVGKTTITNSLINLSNNYGYPTCRFAFGDSIKEETSNLYGYYLPDGYDPEKKKETITLPNLTEGGYELFHSCVDEYKSLSFEEAKKRKTSIRELLQFHGTEVRRRHFGDDYWEERVKSKILKTLNRCRGEKIIFIDDVRFPTEIRLFRDLARMGLTDTKIIKVFPYEGWNFESSHSSEHCLDDFPDTGYDDLIFPVYGRLHMTAVELFKKFVW